MAAEKSDRILVEEIQRGDRRRLAGLYERYSKRLYGYLLRLTRDEAAAEDVFQETWMKVIESIDAFDPARGSFRAWVFRIASNAVIDRARYEKVRRGRELDAPVSNEEDTRWIDHVPSPEIGPEGRAGAAEVGRAMTEALAGIPAVQRSAVLLRHQQGLSYRELAVVLGTPEGTAKVLVHRGVIVLRKRLAEYVS